MDEDTSRSHFLGLPEAWEDYPFGPDVAVFKVGRRMFGTLAKRGDMPSINLKCDPAEALALRDIFEAVRPGYHMNKVHWNTVDLDGSVPTAEVARMIDNSYALVVRTLPRKERDPLVLRHGPGAVFR